MQWGVMAMAMAMAIVFLDLLLIVRPTLMYHCVGEYSDFPVFYQGWDFLSQCLQRPGGGVEYLAAFFAQMLYFNGAGALVLTVHIGLICLLTGCLLRPLGLVKVYGLSLLPAVLLLVIYHNYGFHLASTMALFLALLASYLYTTIPAERPRLRIAVFCLLGAAVYYVAAGGYFLFALLCVLVEWGYRRHWKAALGYVLYAGICPYVISVMMLGASLDDTYSRFLPFSWRIQGDPLREVMIEWMAGLYVLIPVLVLLGGLFRLMTQHHKDVNRSKDRKAESGPLKTGLRTQVVPLLGLLALGLLTWGLVHVTSDPERKASFQVDYALNRGDWQQVLSLASQGWNSDHINHAKVRALYHLDRLPTEMFSFHQHARYLMLNGPSERMFPWYRVGLFYELGYLNHCETALMLSLEINGERPEVLKKLALVSLAKDQTETARVYLTALSKTLFYGDWAVETLQCLEQDSSLPDHVEVQRLRRLNPHVDRGSIRFSSEEVFLDLLARDRGNRMAFDCLMAYYLLNSKLDAFVAHLDQVRERGYDPLPRHYEEAILTYIFVNKKVPELQGYKISQESRTRFKQYLDLAMRYGENRKAAFGPLALKFSDTYFFYYAYGTSGLKHG